MGLLGWRIVSEDICESSHSDTRALIASTAYRRAEGSGIEKKYKSEQGIILVSKDKKKRSSLAIMISTPCFKQSEGSNACR